MRERKTDFRKFLLDKIDNWVLSLLEFVRLMHTYSGLTVFIDQLLRSATSVGANVHEAQGCKSDKQFTHFLEIGMRSAHESSYWLFLVGKMEPKLSIKAHKLRKECIEIEKLLQKSIITLRSDQDGSETND